MKINYLILLISICLSTQANAQLPLYKVDLGDFGKEIAQTDTKTETIRIAIWMPTVYWEVYAAQSETSNYASFKKIIDALNEYVVVCVVNAEHQEGTAEFKTTSESVMRKNIVLKVGTETFKPLSNKQISDDALSIKDVLEPIFASMLGTFGDGMTVFYFKAQNSHGENLIDAREEGSFNLEFMGGTTTWNLPISALYAKKTCPTDNATFPSNYKFCPFHGIELTEPSEKKKEEKKDPIKKEAVPADELDELKHE